MILLPVQVPHINSISTHLIVLFLITHRGTFDLRKEDLELKANERFPVADRSDTEWHYT